jgi:hypothetical protein
LGGKEEKVNKSENPLPTVSVMQIFGGQNMEKCMVGLIGNVFVRKTIDSRCKREKKTLR